MKELKAEWNLMSFGIDTIEAYFVKVFGYIDGDGCEATKSLDMNGNEWGFSAKKAK